MRGSRRQDRPDEGAARIGVGALVAVEGSGTGEDDERIGVVIGAGSGADSRILYGGNTILAANWLVAFDDPEEQLSLPASRLRVLPPDGQA